MLDYFYETGLERAFDDLFRTFWTRPLALTTRKAFLPATDVFARDGDLVVRIELPGIDPPKDVKVGVERGELVITGERRKKEEVHEDAYYRMESSYGSFRRVLPVPEGVAEKDITAEYHDGILEVVVPKGAARIAEPTMTEIPVKVAKAIKAA
jgi:HSP20 family protein